MTTRTPSRTAASLLGSAGTASARVIAARMLAFSDPTTALSAWHQSEAQRMSTEKLDAARDGMLAASAELSLLPARMLQLASRPAAWTPAGWPQACMDAMELWIGVGNAALRPAARTVVRNQSRLSRRSGG